MLLPTPDSLHFRLPVTICEDGSEAHPCGPAIHGTSTRVWLPGLSQAATLCVSTARKRA